MKDQITINGRQFGVKPMDDSALASYKATVTNLAKRRDRPVQRFLRKHCEGLTREERQDVLQAWMTTPGWDDPPEAVLRETARTPPAIVALMRRVLEPVPKPDEYANLLGENPEALYWQLCDAIAEEKPPTEEEIRESNRMLRELLKGKRGPQAKREDHASQATAPETRSDPAAAESAAVPG